MSTVLFDANVTVYEEDARLTRLSRLTCFDPATVTKLRLKAEELQRTLNFLDEKEAKEAKEKFDNQLKHIERECKFKMTLDYSTDVKMPKIRVGDVRQMVIVNEIEESKDTRAENEPDYYSAADFDVTLRGSVYRLGDKDTTVQLSFGGHLCTIEGLSAGHKFEMGQKVYLMIRKI